MLELTDVTFVKHVRVEPASFQVKVNADLPVDKQIIIIVTLHTSLHIA